MADNALVRYEVLFLTVPGLTTEESSLIESQFNEIISNNKGKTVSYEKWGKYNLAYQVNDNAYGIYFLSRFELPAPELAAILEKIRQFFAVKYSETVMRHMFTFLPAKVSLEYKRPESMEEAPRREQEGFGGRRERSGYGRSEGRFTSRREERAEASHVETAEESE